MLLRNFRIWIVDPCNTLTQRAEAVLQVIDKPNEVSMHHAGSVTLRDPHLTKRIPACRAREGWRYTEVRLGCPARWRET